MGQYYTPILYRPEARDNEPCRPLKFFNNVKWHGISTHQCVTGYYNSERRSPFFITNGLKLLEHSYIGNKVTSMAMNDLMQYGKAKVIWKGDYSERSELRELGFTDNEIRKIDRIEKHTEYYHPCICSDDIVETIIRTDEVYLHNIDKKEYVRMSEYYHKDDCTIHPLPLLTALGNGRGGGDFHKESYYIGRWAGDTIEVRIREAPKESEDITSHCQFKED